MSDTPGSSALGPVVAAAGDLEATHSNAPQCGPTARDLHGVVSAAQRPGDGVASDGPSPASSPPQTRNGPVSADDFAPPGPGPDGSARSARDHPGNPTLAKPGNEDGDSAHKAGPSRVVETSWVLRLWEHPLGRRAHPRAACRRGSGRTVCTIIVNGPRQCLARWAFSAPANMPHTDHREHGSARGSVSAELGAAGPKRDWHGSSARKRDPWRLRQRPREPVRLSPIRWP